MTQYDDDADRLGDEDQEPSEPTCRRCNTAGLTWHHTGERWALMDDDGRLHTCTTASADDFDDIS